MSRRQATTKQCMTKANKARAMLNKLKRGLWFAFLAVCGLLGASLWNVSQLKSQQPAPASLTDKTPFDEQLALTHLSQSLQFPTISHQTLLPETEQAFQALRQYLKSSFPLVFSQLELKTFKAGLLLRWKGQKSALKPILMAAHLDVVPAEAPHSWLHPPFSGELDREFIWGRGALDDKNTALALLEACESLLKQGWQPQRDLYLALGQDEEIGGQQGAALMASYLRQAGIQLEAVLDEGLAILPGSMIGLEPPVALIGIAEKGYLTLELKVDQTGGHASMPQADTAVDILAQALVKLHQAPLPARLSGPASELFKWLSPEMQGLQKFALANLWLFEPILLQQLQAKPSTNALIRTTMAPTMLSASPKENVLAASAQALINLRVLPGDTPEQIQSHFRQCINDSRVQIRSLAGGFGGLASRVSATDSAFFQSLSTTIRQVFPTALIAPSLVLAATDSRHYEDLSENTYRFMPVPLSVADLERIHGKDERLSHSDYLHSIVFFQALIKKL